MWSTFRELITSSKIKAPQQSLRNIFGKSNVRENAIGTKVEEPTID
jgi:hypothetical protein